MRCSTALSDLRKTENDMSIGTLIKYGAVTAKARAMFGNRLKEDDYRALSGSKTLAEVNSYIKYKTVYGSLLENEDEKELHRERLEKLLRTQLDEDYKRLSNFISGEKKKSLDTYKMQREVNFILTVLRGLRNGTAEGRTEFIGSVLADGGDRLKKKLSICFRQIRRTNFLRCLKKRLMQGQ